MCTSLEPCCTRPQAGGLGSQDAEAQGVEQCIKHLLQLALGSELCVPTQLARNPMRWGPFIACFRRRKQAQRSR